MPPPQSEVRTWRREIDGAQYLCSTDPNLVQLDALNAALASDMLWWARGLSNPDLKKMVENSWCFGIYKTSPNPPPNSSQEPSVEMVGFGRVVTDYVTICYLTDVYVLEEYQKKGLGTWLADCLNDAISAWPEMRGFLLLTADPHAIRLYEKALGAKDVKVLSPELIVMNKRGPAGKGRDAP